MNQINIQGAGGAMFVSDGATLSAACIKFTTQGDGIRVTNVQSNARFDGFRWTNSAAYAYTTKGFWFDGNGTDSDCVSMTHCSGSGFGKGLMLSSVSDHSR
jgi:hypothetical protein